MHVTVSDPTLNMPGGGVHVVFSGATPPLPGGGSKDTCTGSPLSDCTSTFEGHATVTTGGGGGAVGEPQASMRKATMSTSSRCGHDTGDRAPRRGIK